MNNGKLFGVVGSAIGIAIGTYLAAIPVLQGLKLGAMSGLDAGLSFAAIGAIIGFSCAVVAIVYNGFGTNT